MNIYGYLFSKIYIKFARLLFNLLDGYVYFGVFDLYFVLSTAAVYGPFFKEAWERHEEVESLYCDEPSPPAYDDGRLQSLDKRPPAPLPKTYDNYLTTKSSTSNRFVLR
jgi:hypothetical protein